ncbi:putative YigZ family protein [Pararhizobium capsulatum DSM 1112]|uniref:YigZ family protein n=1 Tax=Pararhizobium capsulatum DSM 1112 TaxID=1121113 RepID=A0ABU0BKM0_9HYPH|nr:YigZ family protein [Pararhizobium capsulatum]MDQ0318792.1 putative YigZ family protein [Pararhizobium capsulatum DSM 1112]
MFTLRTTETFSQDIKKSRFIAIYGPVADEQEAKDFIAAHSDPAANHNCWAYRIGQIYRFNDDGEPSGTAGKPILQAIDGQGLDHVAVVVIRWFGGILLGSGGLIRAYGGTAAMGLRAAEKTEVIETDGAKITCDFSDLAIVKARLFSNSVTIFEENFTGTGAILEVQMPKPLREVARTLVRDLTRGRATMRFDDE